jgi:hypothetical protein
MLALLRCLQRSQQVVVSQILKIVYVVVYYKKYVYSNEIQSQQEFHQVRIETHLLRVITIIAPFQQYNHSPR